VKNHILTTSPIIYDKCGLSPKFFFSLSLRIRGSNDIFFVKIFSISPRNYSGTKAQMRLALKQIRRDGGTQSRATLHQRTIEEYREAMQQGCSFPPVIVFYDGQEYLLSDGFHRVAAALLAGWQSIEVELKLGTKREAILYAVGANAAHGLRRTLADKHHAVKLLLEDAEWGQWSDRALARATVTSHPFVAKVRANLTGKTSSERIYTTKHGTQAVMKTSQIGKSRRTSADLDPLEKKLSRPLVEKGMDGLIRMR
jgi:hypothetical protein